MNKKQKRKKRPITLLEIMIVIFLIGLIGGVVGYNMKGSLDKGRAFKSEMAASRLKEILLLKVAEGKDINEVVSEPERFLAMSGLCDKPDKLLKDGWNESFTIRKYKGDDITITSKKLNDYNKKHGIVQEEQESTE